MKFSNEFNWVTSYTDNDFWSISSTLNWDGAADLVLSDYSLMFLIESFLRRTMFWTDALLKTSFLDTLFSFSSDSQLTHQTLSVFLFLDLLTYFSNTFFSLQLLFYTDYQDSTAILIQHSPELVLAVTEYSQAFWSFSSFSDDAIAVFDFFGDSLASTDAEFVTYPIFFVVWVWLAITTNHVFRLFGWNNPLDAYFIRINLYLFTLSRELRIQYEAALKVFFLAFLYISIAIAFFDDDQEEVIEGFSLSCVYLFLFTFLYFLYKYSIHFFAFLEASVTEGRSLNFVYKQFVKDCLNTFAFVLRFLLLLIRLNIYDSLDDFYDSYYIFVGDFDDDEYFSDALVNSFTHTFFDTDVKDDRSVFLEDEFDFNLDLFSLYFVIWGKFTLFGFFIIEEIARVILALYITFLIIFELHAVNYSYTEDTYFNIQKSIFCTKTPSNV